MTQLLDHVEYLTKEVGARPAGTEEEHDAALYITEQFQKEAHFPVAIEEFTTKSNFTLLRPICCAIVIVVTLLALIAHVLAVPAFILAAAATVVYVLDALGIMDISRLFARGASQNVVAKYQPNPEPAAVPGRRGRSRKIVLVARYDSGKVVPGLVQRVESMGLPLGLICMGAMILSTFFLLIRIFIGAGDGVGVLIFNILTILALIVVALPLVKAIMLMLAPYNEGANNNATGVAAMLEIARRISSGSMSEADIADGSDDGVVIHGIEEALQSGLVPEGVQIAYEIEEARKPEPEPELEIAPPDIEPLDEEERLLSAKAALAAFTGQPVERKVYGSVATKLVDSRASDEPLSQDDYVGERNREQRPASENVAQNVEVASPVFAAPVASATPQVEDVEGFQNAPDWFVAAQQKAKKQNTGQTKPVQRSRYTDAIEAVEREAAERERARQEEDRLRREAELRAASQGIIASGSPEGNRQEEAEEQPVIEFEPIPEMAPRSNDGWGNFASMDSAHSVPVMEPAPVYNQVEEVAPLEPVVEEVAEYKQEIEPAPEPVEEVSNYETAPYEEEEAYEDFDENEAEVDVDESEIAHSDPTMQIEPVDVTDEAAEEAEPEAVPAPSPRLSSAIPAVMPEVDEDVPVRANRRRIASLPSIDPQPEKARATEASPSRSGMFRKLRADVPSLSGVIRMQEAGEDVSQNPAEYSARRQEAPAARQVPAVQQAPVLDSGAVPAIETAAPVARPVREELAPRVDYDMSADAELVEEDFNDAYEEEVVEEPKRQPRPRTQSRSRAKTRTKSKAKSNEKGQGLFSRFLHKEEEELNDTPQEWLDVDEGFEARSVGKKRGSWESFRNDAEDDQYADFDDEETPGRSNKWEGGAFSRLRLGHVDMHSGEGAEGDEPEPAVEEQADRELNKQIEQSYHFRNPSYNTEIWFVAVGAEVDLNDGARAFIAEHADELKGAMIVEIESLGLGELSTVTEEGLFHKVKASSRVKRFTRAASAATGLSLGTVNLMGTDSVASLAQRSGLQAMHLTGVEEGRPALKGSVDDVLENIDEEILEENVDFLMELLKHN